MEASFKLNHEYAYIDHIENHTRSSNLEQESHMSVLHFTRMEQLACDRMPNVINGNVHILHTLAKDCHQQVHQEVV